MSRRSRIQAEIKQGRPFASPAHEAFVALLRTGHLLRRSVEAVVSREGLTSPQYNVLRILRGAGGPLPTMEIAARMIEPAPGITRLASSLAAAGLLRREQWSGDRRCVLCEITPAGAEVLERLERPVNELDASLGAILSAGRLAALIETLDEIRAAQAFAET
jgi:DNA-binding MarR family transcriptional regulator